MRFKYYLRGAGIGVIAATLILSIAFLLQDQISDEEVIRRAIELGMVMEDEKESSPGTLADMGQQGASSVDLETGSDGLTDETGSQGGDSSADAAGSGDGQDLSGNAADPDPNQGTDSGDSQGEDQGTDSGNSQDSGHSTDSGDIQDSGQKDAGSGDSDQKTPDSSSDKKDSNKKDSDDKNSDKKDDKEDTDKKDSDRPNRRPSGNTATVTIEAGDVSRIVSAKVFEAGLVESADEFNSYLGEHGYANQLQPGTYEINKDATFRQIAVILTTRQ